MKTLFNTTLLLALCLPLSSVAQQLPQPSVLPQQGSCPSGYSSDSRYCTPSGNATYAFLKAVISNSCPIGYASSGAYCVAFSNNADYVFVKTGSSCPSGFMSSGNYCIKSN